MFMFVASPFSPLQVRNLTVGCPSEVRWFGWGGMITFRSDVAGERGKPYAHDRVVIGKKDSDWFHGECEWNGWDE